MYIIFNVNFFWFSYYVFTILFPFFPDTDSKQNLLGIIFLENLVGCFRFYGHVFQTKKVQLIKSWIFFSSIRILHSLIILDIQSQSKILEFLSNLKFFKAPHFQSFKSICLLHNNQLILLLIENLEPHIILRLFFFPLSNLMLYLFFLLFLNEFLHQINGSLWLLPYIFILYQINLFINKHIGRFARIILRIHFSKYILDAIKRNGTNIKIIAIIPSIVFKTFDVGYIMTS